MINIIKLKKPTEVIIKGDNLSGNTGLFLKV
jgi:hypothetical protein